MKEFKTTPGCSWDVIKTIYSDFTKRDISTDDLNTILKTKYTDLFASNVIWHPPTRWADEVIEECAAFPSGDNDDLVDSTTQALLRFRQGGWIRTAMDDWDDEPKYRRPVEYY